jgi:hypothetical protein
MSYNFSLGKILTYFNIKDTRLFFLRLSICFLFALLPFRFLIFFGVPLYPRICLGLFFAFLIFIESPNLIPCILNNKFFQIFFYWNLFVEEQLKSLKAFVRVPIFLLLIGTPIYSFFFIDQVRLICVFLLFYWSFYRALKANFVSVTNDWCFISLRLEGPKSKRKFFTWADVIENMNIVSIVLFHTSVVNRLGPYFFKAKFLFLLEKIL